MFEGEFVFVFEGGQSARPAARVLGRRPASRLVALARVSLRATHPRPPLSSHTNSNTKPHTHSTTPLRFHPPGATANYGNLSDSDRLALCQRVSAGTGFRPDPAARFLL